MTNCNNSEITLSLRQIINQNMSTIIKSAVLFLCGTAFATSLYAQTEQLFNGVSFHESLASAKEKISPNVLSHFVLTLDEPQFPLAKNTESHLLCTNLKTPRGTLAQVVFTFADDQLHYIEAHGNAINVFFSDKRDSIQDFMGYKVVIKDRLFGQPEKDVIWLLTEEAVHPNLFTWKNPYLTEGGPTSVSYDTKGEIPDFIEMGGALDDLRPILQTHSDFVVERELDGSDPNAQLQLDCFGIEYAGFQRKVEARFGNGKLNTLWILTGKGEEDRIRTKLVARYGKPLFVNEDWEIYDNWTVGLRKDKPEVLVLTSELGQFYKKEFFKQ